MNYIKQKKSEYFHKSVEHSLVNDHETRGWRTDRELKTKTRLIYVYDFLNLWTFLIELVEVVEQTTGVNYPNLIYSNGQIPTKIPEKNFKAENTFEEEDSEDELGDYDNYDDFYN